MAILNDKEYDEDGVLEATFYCKRCDDDLALTADPGVDEKYVKKCVEHYNKLSNDLIDKICDALCRYCESVREKAGDDFDEDIPEDVKGRDILDYCAPVSLNIEAPPSPGIIGYSIEGECDWDPEHGVQIIIRDDKLILVSSFDGRTVWGDDDMYDSESNYAVFKLEK